MNFIKLKNNNSIILYNGMQNGRKCYFFILANKIKAEILKRAKPGTDMVPSDFGDVIECGYGENPPQWLIDSIITKYNT